MDLLSKWHLILLSAGVIGGLVYLIHQNKNLSVVPICLMSFLGVLFVISLFLAKRWLSEYRLRVQIVFFLATVIISGLCIYSSDDLSQDIANNAEQAEAQFIGDSLQLVRLAALKKDTLANLNKLTTSLNERFEVVNGYATAKARLVKDINRIDSQLNTQIGAFNQLCEQYCKLVDSQKSVPPIPQSIRTVALKVNLTDGRPIILAQDTSATYVRQ